MKLSMKKTALIVLSLGAVACSQSKDGGSAPAPAPVAAQPLPGQPGYNPYTAGLAGQIGMQNVNGVFMYEHKEYGRCTTGKQIFNSLQDMCNGLLNEALNQNCGQVLRNQDYFLRCRGGMTGVVGAPMPGAVIPGSNNVITNDRVKAVWCGITAQDNSGKLFSSFKNRDNQKMFSWDSKTQSTFSLPFGLTSRYGSASLTLTPDVRDGMATAKISLKQSDSDTEYSIKGGLNQSVRLYLEDQKQDITVAIDCGLQGEKSLPALAYTKVACDGKLNGDVLSLEIPWDGRAAKSQAVEIESKNSSELMIELVPGATPSEAQVQVSSNELARGKRLLGKGTLRGGFSLRQVDASSARLSLNMNCELK